MSRGKSRRAGGDLPSRVFVDTGAFVGLLSAGDGHHDEADALFRSAARERVRLLSTNLVLAEVHRLVLFEVGTAAALVAVTHVTESSLLEIVYSGPEHHQHGLAWLKKLSDQRIIYTDATSLTIQLIGCKNGFVSSAEVIRKIKAAGWTLVRTKGSHQQFMHPVRPGIVTVPHPKKDFPIGTLKSIERQSGVVLT